MLLYSTSLFTAFLPHLSSYSSPSLSYTSFILLLQNKILWSCSKNLFSERVLFVMTVSDKKYKEICRTCLPLKTLAHRQTNLLLLRYKHNFGLLKSTGLRGDQYVLRTSAEIPSRSFITSISKKIRSTCSSHVCWGKTSPNCSHTWIICLALIFSCQHQTTRAANETQSLRKWTRTSAFLNLFCVDSSGSSKWWAQSAALPSEEDWHHHSFLCRCVCSGTLDELGSKDTGEQMTKLECKPCFLGQQAKKIK